MSDLVNSIISINHSNKLTNKLIYSFQERSLYSGVFLIAITLFLLKKRKQIILSLSELKISFIFFFLRLKNTIKRQFLKPNYKYTIPFLVILMISILIRLYFVNGSLRYDEGFTYYYFSKKPFYLTMAFYDYPNNHIFHTLLVKVCCFFFGDSVFSLRLPSLFFGITLIPLVYYYVGRFYSKNAALIAVSFVSVSSVLISYSVNSRGYSLVFSAFVLVLILGEFLKRENNKFLWFLFILVQVIGIYTIPIMLYVCMIVNSYLIVTSVFLKKEYLTPSKILKSALAVAVLSILLYLPVYLLMGAEVVLGNDYVKSRTYYEVFAILPDQMKYMFNYFTMDFPLLLNVVLFGGIVTALITMKQSRQLFITILFFLFCIFVIQRVIPFARVLAFLFPIFYVFSAIGIAYLLNLMGKLKSNFSAIFACFLILMVMSFQLVQTNSPMKEFDEPPIRNQTKVFPYLRKVLKKQDRLLYCFPLEASVKGYFTFEKLNRMNLENEVYRSKSVYFLVGNQFKQSVDLVLKKNEINSKLFYSKYKFESKKDFDSTISIFEYKVKS